MERIPRVYWDLTTSRVLTMEFLEGPSVATYLRWIENGNETQLARLREQGFIPDVYARNVMTNFLSDAIRHGVFHADMHPANILILPGNVVGYVDFGIVAMLTPEARRKQIELTQAYATGNADDIYREFLNICTVTPHADLKGMRAEVGRLVKKWYEEPAVGGRARFRVSVTVAMVDLMNILRFYGVLVDREMIKYIRSIFLTDGLVNRIAPGIDVAGALRKVVEEYLFEQARRKVLSRAGGLALLSDLTIWLKTGPSAMLRALDMFERRELNGRNNPPVLRGEAERGARGVRSRFVAMAAVWTISILFLVLSGSAPSWRNAPFFAAMIAVFMTLWTIWMLVLLRRLLPR
jgi:ubiquinone biosynthesis protein